MSAVLRRNSGTALFIILSFLLFQVSWVRQKDLHVLTSGALTFTGDARFAPRRARDSDVHTLQIRHTQLRDAGRYICQVNLEPKISRSVYLTVRGEFLCFDVAFLEVLQALPCESTIESNTSSNVRCYD